MAKQRRRRQYRTGSVYRRASDGLWVGTLEAGETQTGARRRITVSAKSEAECRRKLEAKQHQLVRDGKPAAGTRVTNVKSYAESWLEARRSEVRSKPWATDASAVRRWIVPTIGQKRFADLTPQDVRAVAHAQRDAGRSSSTRLRTQITLMAMLKAAMLDGHPVPARVLLVKPPAKAVSDREAMDPREVEAVMNVAIELLPHWSRWLVQVLYGQRPAEVLGLTWDHVDFEAGVINVEWQLQPLPYLDRTDKAKGFVVPDGMRVRHLVDAWHLTPPKSKKGERLLPMLPIVKAALLEWRTRAPESPYGLVWPTETGRPANEEHDRDEWYGLQVNAGVSHPTKPRAYYIYEARHAFATRLMEEGVDENVITALMGHSSIVTSRGYQHADQRHALEAMERVAARLAIAAPLPAAG